MYKYEIVVVIWAPAGGGGKTGRSPHSPVSMVNQKNVFPCGRFFSIWGLFLPLAAFFSLLGGALFWACPLTKIFAVAHVWTVCEYIMTMTMTMAMTMTMTVIPAVHNDNDTSRTS